MSPVLRQNRAFASIEQRAVFKSYNDLHNNVPCTRTFSCSAGSYFDDFFKLISDIRLVVNIRTCVCTSTVEYTWR